MEYSNIRVLLTEGGSRQTLPMAKAFSELGCKVTTLNATALDVGNTSKYPVEKIIVKGINDNYELAKETIDKLLKTRKYDLVVPMSDFTAGILAHDKEYFSQYAQIATNDTEVFNLAFDKLNTMKVCMENNIPCPQTFLSSDLVSDLSKIKYPVVVKPRSACGSIGFNVVENEQELRTILNETRNSLGPMFIQEYIPQTGKQFNVHMFLDREHKVKTALATEKCRWFPVDGGASTLCVSIENKEILDICEALLKKMNWIGYCDVDLMLDPRDNKPKVIEVNARISANVKMCYIANMNIAKQILETYFNKEVTQYCGYKVDLRLRCLHTDLLWFIKSPNRFISKPSWFSAKNTRDQIFSITDLLPWFSFSIQSLMKYKDEMQKRNRIK